MEKNYEIVDSLASLSKKLEEVRNAQRVFATYTIKSFI